MRVEVAPKPVVVLLVVMTLFALTALFCGAMLIAYAPGMKVVSIGVGIVFVLAGLKMAIWSIVQWRAIRAIDVAADGTWVLHDNLGRSFTLPAGEPAKVEVIAYMRTILRPMPQRLHQAAGRIVTRARTWRIATNAHTTYDRVLRELGLADAAPREGLESYERVA